ncbi:MAG: hypothetical protein SH847_25940 [Roseiflexaceae bacterium]|nr:hypothetical protein [Roseiflexaceae bacterium]
MRRRGGSLITAIALLITLWLIWSRLHIVVLVNIPWWGLLLIGLVLFLVIDYLLDRILRRS